MADLDDFFAKKDKKKARGKKFTTTDQIAKKLEETGKKSEKTKKEKEKTTIPPQPVVEGEEQVHHPVQEEDEWKDFEEEKKDYTGLKIQNLQLGEPGEDDDDEGEDEEQEENEAGERVPRRKVHAGPWKMLAQAQPAESEEPEEEKNQEAPSSGGGGASTYLPPHLRNQPTSHPQPRTRSKVAPDINSEEFFPSLSASASVEPAGAWGRRARHGEADSDRFEEVRNSKSHSRHYGESAKMGGAPKLALGNKYGALSHADQS